MDDSIEEKPYTDENEIVFWHHSHMHSRHVKGINILSCMVVYGDVSLPVGYEIMHEDIEFSDIKTKMEALASSILHLRTCLVSLV